ncbi:MAG: hypothetical protein JRN58_06850 [Nitrososphaerota archaeon]|nr:hypothetical protein [Nitrososphaerota archaeon]
MTGEHTPEERRGCEEANRWWEEHGRPAMTEEEFLQPAERLASEETKESAEHANVAYNGGMQNHRIRMTEFDVRNSLRAPAYLGTKSDARRRELFDHLILSHGKVKLAQARRLDSRARTTLVVKGWEIVVLADVLRERGAYTRSRFYQKMQLFKTRVTENMPLKHAWGHELRRKRESRRRWSRGGYEEDHGDEDDYEECLDPAEIAEKRGCHREFGEWGRLRDQDGEEVYEDLSRGDDGWLYNDDGVRVERWREPHEGTEVERCHA